MEVRLRSDEQVSKIGVFDIETDNHYEHLTRMHCVWIQCPVTMNAWGYRPHEIGDALKHLMNLDVLVAHNGINFDVVATKKIYPWFRSKGIFDTFTLSSMMYPGRKRHSLKSWGEDLKILKGDFGDTADWSEFTEEMFYYCEQDVAVTTVLYKYLCTAANFDFANPPSMLWR